MSTISRRTFIKGAAAGLAALPLLARSPSAAASTRELGGEECPDPGDIMPKRQFRGVWIATVSNLDWPSQPGLPSEAQKAQLRALLDAAQGMGMNAVVLQVRPATDAFYPSRYAPWSQYLTGMQGQDPGYDPLAFAIEEAHNRNLELHAWFNPYRVSLQSDITKLAPNNPARQHPDWVHTYGGQLWFDPGLPQVRQLIEASILEVVERYDVDAVHFDDYFYPYPSGNEEFPDEATYRQYGQGFSSKADWRRHNVNLLVQELSGLIKRSKPWVKFGISPFGIWRNKSTDPLGSDTSGFQSYDGTYADTRLWVKSNWLDYIAPQIYWSFHFRPAAYEALVPWWSQVVDGTNVHLYIGQAAYKIGTSTQSPEWSDPDEMPNHLWFNLQYPEVKGDIYFRISNLLANPLGFRDRLEQELYRHPALVPVMPWLGGSAPHPVALTRAQRYPQGVELEWQAIPHDNNATYYAIYRFDSKVRSHDTCTFNDPRQLIATVRRVVGSKPQTYLDASAGQGQGYAYYVTALDRLHHESWPSNRRSP